ncbi:hypothetical protein KEM54_006791 [Ascosphaera aggregata]|nr:hypothetical protein KEM54_006791 [Ascosphaera aggregata]
MDGRKPSTSANNYGFLASHNGPSGNARKGTSAMIATPTPPSPSDKETGCGIKRALSRRCRKGFSCFMNVNTVKVSSGEGLDVSRPTNVAHVTHVGFDDRTGEYTVRSATGMETGLVTGPNASPKASFTKR